MSTSKFNFGKNFKASAEFKDLEKLGWEFEPIEEDVNKVQVISLEMAKEWAYENYHVEISIDNEGRTFYTIINTKKAGKGIFEGSDREETGDDQQTIKDLEQLHREGKLWNEQNDWM